jgi:hypothetical protein
LRRTLGEGLTSFICNTPTGISDNFTSKVTGNTVVVTVRTGNIVSYHAISLTPTFPFGGVLNYLVLFIISGPCVTALCVSTAFGQLEIAPLSRPDRHE